MKEKKTVGFDILDNVGLDRIDRIGTDMDMLDEKTKKRILEMTKKRFNDAIKGENTGIEKIVTDENAEVVENVEVYNRSKIRKIMTGVVNTAAVVGLAAGSVFLVKNIGRGDIDKPVEPDLPAVSTTEPANQTQEEIARNKRLEYEVQATFECYEKNIVGLSVDDLKIDYAYLDINNDSVDELFIRSKVLDIPESVSTTICFFNGTEYIAFYRIVADEFKFDLQNRKYYEILKENDDDSDYCLLRILTWENVEFSDGDQDYLTYFTPQDNYEGGQFYLHDNNRCTKEEFENAIAEYENCVGAEPNFIPYTVKRESAEDLSHEEKARNKRIEDLIRYVYVSHNTVLDKERFDDTLEIGYAYLDINNDSVSELLIRYNFLDGSDYKGTELNFFDGTEYIPFENIGYTAKFDLNSRKLYELSEGYENEYWLDIKTWENIELSSDTELFTLTDNYYSALDPFADSTAEIMYFHNNEQCTEEEFENTLTEYDSLVGNLKYRLYIPDESLFKGNSENNTISEQSAEETARNKRIEDYIEYLYYYFDGETDKDKFYDSIKIDYAYLDINNDSVSELIIRYHNLNDFTPYYEGTELNYFDGIKYVPVGEMNTTFKFDLENRKLYQLSESHEGGYSLYIRTWKNVEFSANMDFFALQDDYHSNVVNYEPIEYTYTHNDEEITQEEYEKAMDEYENFVGAEVNYMPYNLKKPHRACAEDVK